MKREADGSAMGGGGPTNPNKRYRHGDDELRLLIPSKVAGSIIGKGGHNIAKLRSQYKASITVPDCPGPERVLTISSDLETVLQVLHDMIPNLEESIAKHSSDEIDLRMLVHQSQAGCIIGKGGLKIKELREKTGVKIKIYSNCCPHSTDRLISVQGKADTCMKCIRELMATIKTSPLKGVNKPYDPHNYDDFYAEEYGGYGGADNGQGKGFGGGRGNAGGGGGGAGGMSRRDNRGGLDMNRGGFGGPRGGPRGPMSGPPDRGYGANARNNSAGNFDAARGVAGAAGGPGPGGFNGNRGGGPAGPPFSAPNFNGRGDNGWGMQGGAPNGMGGGNSAMGGLGGNQANQGGNKTSTQVTIPKDLAGAIIGKGGARIRKIRSDSGAGITIDEPLPGSNDRIITISGMPNQIQMAQYLLQESVRENSGRY